MGLSTLGKWLSKEEVSNINQSDSPGWQEVILPAAPGQGWAAEIAFKDGVILRLGAATAAATLPRWLENRS